VVSVIAYFVVDRIIGLRVSAEQEGLDLSSHGERAEHP
jgi:ammonia channel protein AmtB